MTTLAHAKNYLAQQYRRAKQQKDWVRAVAVFRAYDILEQAEGNACNCGMHLTLRMPLTTGRKP